MDPWTHALFQDLLTTFPELHLFSLEGPLVGEPSMDSLDLLAEADSAEKKYHNLMTYVYIDCLYDLNDLNDLKSTFLVAKPHVYICLLAKSLKHAG